MAPHSPWLNRFAVLTALSTLGLIVIGGLVTSHGAGMAVPDWPNTYGYNMFLFPFSQWVGGIFYEHSHRLMGAWVGLLTTILAIWLWTRETRGSARWVGVTLFVIVVLLLGVRQLPVYYALAGLALVTIVAALFLALRAPGLRWWGVVAFGAVVLQGVLGGLRVVRLQDELGIFHATLAQLFFVLMCALVLATSRWWRAIESSEVPAHSSRLAALVLTTTLLVLLQLIVGATMRHQHAGLAISDFPLAHGEIWPDTSPAAIERYNSQRLEITAVKPITAFQIWMQMAHRLLALVIVGFIAACAWRARKHLGAAHPTARMSLAWLALVGVQFGLGAWTIWSNKAADIATLHVLVGALTLVTGALTFLVTARKLRIAIGGLRLSNERLAHSGPVGLEA